MLKPNPALAFVAALSFFVMSPAPVMATEQTQHSVIFSIDAAGQLLWVCPENSEYRSWQADYAMQVLQSAAPYPALPPGAGEHAEFRATIMTMCGKFLDCVVTKVESTDATGTRYSLKQLFEMAERQRKMR